MWLSAGWILSTTWINQIFGLWIELFSQTFSYKDTWCLGLSESISSFYCSNNTSTCIFGHFLWFRKQRSYRHGGWRLTILVVSYTHFSLNKKSRSGTSNGGESYKHCYCWHLFSPRCVKYSDSERGYQEWGRWWELVSRWTVHIEQENWNLTVTRLERVHSSWHSKELDICLI